MSTSKPNLSLKLFDPKLHNQFLCIKKKLKFKKISKKLEDNLKMNRISNNNDLLKYELIPRHKEDGSEEELEITQL